MKARVRVGRLESSVDLAHPVSLAIEVTFTARDPRHFGAPGASAQPLVVAGFSGSVAAGASCNCSTITLTPHCNGTHTECAGHLTRQPLDAFRIVPVGLVPALVVTVTPEPADATADTSRPPARAHDRLITHRVLADAWSAAASRSQASPRALVMRTRQNAAAHPTSDTPPPYLSYEAALWIVAREIEHLVVDLPSLDRTQDQGALTAHRVFFGLPPASHELERARRAQCTVTELARVPQSLPDGEYLLELQVPALAGDAVPSRPLLYPLQTCSP